MILHHTSEIKTVAKRIVSVVPSQTELLYHLGVDDATVGITKFCVHPTHWLTTKTIVGGTKNINAAAIHALQPDLIIANIEENVKEQVEALANDYPVWLTDVSNLQQALQMIEDIGMLTGTETKASALVSEIKNNFAALSFKQKIRTAYLIWRKPYMTIGGDTFINDIMVLAGFDNVFAGKSRYPQIDIAMLKESNCSLVLLSTEPYPFKQEHIDELQTQLPGVIIALADGEMFSWYGSRLALAPAYLHSLIEKVASEKILS